MDSESPRCPESPRIRKCPSRKINGLTIPELLVDVLSLPVISKGNKVTLSQADKDLPVDNRLSFPRSFSSPSSLSSSLSSSNSSSRSSSLSSSNSSCSSSSSLSSSATCSELSRPPSMKKIPSICDFLTSFRNMANASKNDN